VIVAVLVHRRPAAIELRIVALLCCGISAIHGQER
jgi:hypothetical protein